MSDRELLQQALNALISIEAWLDRRNLDGFNSSEIKLLEALRTRLATCDRCGEVNPTEIHTCTPKQPEPEPVAWRRSNWSGSPDDYVYRDYDDPLLNTKGENVGEPLYTAPPKREWVGLTKTEFNEATNNLEDLEDCWIAIEAKLKEKNNG